MNSLLALLKDKRRAQRGSVLSGVLIITAFIGIVSGALMMELSGTFLLSHNLVNRVAVQATVSSATEVAFDQLSAMPVNGGCPTLSPLTLNGRTAAVNYLNCYPVVDRNVTGVSPAATSNAFVTDGTHAGNDYLIGDSGGTIFDYPFGSTSWRWRLALGGSLTAPISVVANPAGAGTYFDVVPLSGAGCAGANYCGNVQSDSGARRTPTTFCVDPTGGAVVGAAPSPSFSATVFFADRSGTLTAHDLSRGCAEVFTTSTSSPAAAGPVVFRCSSCSRPDQIYVATSNGQLQQYTYRTDSLSGPQSSISLPWSDVAGMAVEGPSLPARLAISFNSGGVALVQINTDGSMSWPAIATHLPTGIAKAPYWGPNKVIGVGGQNGTLYLLDTNLNRAASYAVGATINTTPTADSAGDWFVGADNGNLYEVSAIQPSLHLANESLPNWFGQVRSSVQVGGCGTILCAYLGSANSNFYMVPLGARNVVLTTCISSTPPACSGVNPRLWTSVQVTAPTSSPSVHMSGFSYYST